MNNAKEKRIRCHEKKRVGREKMDSATNSAAFCIIQLCLPSSSRHNKTYFTIARGLNFMITVDNYLY